MDTGLIDLSQVVAGLASFGAVAWCISKLRSFGLDRLLAPLSDAQKTDVLQALNYALNFLLILVASLVLAHHALDLRLIESVAAAAGLAAGASHLTFRANAATQKAKVAAPEPSYPEIPPSESGEEPEPPSDDPAAMALAA